MNAITPVNRVQNTLSYSQREKNKQEAQVKIIRFSLEYLIKHGGSKQ